VAGFAGPDSLYGTEDDTTSAVCDTMTIRIPTAVLSALQDSMGVSATVGNVLEFANIALAGEETYDATLKGVWHAVKNLNRAFKRCRFLVYCQQDSVVVIDVKHSTDAFPSGVYFVRMSAVGVDTGALYGQTAKLLVLR